MIRWGINDGFVEGPNRSESTLLPALLDDYVTADNPVRAIDVFMDGLDLGKLGFVCVQSLATGRPERRSLTAWWTSWHRLIWGYL